MADRYGNRYAPRTRSPPPSFSARASLPIDISGYHMSSPHHHVVPTGHREVIPTRSSSVANNGALVTTYKVTADGIPTRGSSVREGSRSRRFTVDNHNRPPIIITESSPRERAVIHSGGGMRPGSPLSNPYRSSEEDYVATPASSRHGRQHTKRHSTSMDNGDIRGSGLRVAPVREPNYANIRSRPIYPNQLVRHADNVAEDFGENGYGYTNPQEVVRYDLQRTAPPPVVQTRPRRDSYEGRTSRPTSITGYNDIVPRSYDGRERGPPPSTRGFDRIPGSGRGWEPPQIRMPVPPSPSSMSPMDPIPRPAPFEPVEPARRISSRNSSRARPTSLYHDREPRRGPREDYYEARDDDRDWRERTHHNGRHEDGVEQRGYGLRAERPERVERSDRHDRRERGSDEDRSDYKEHKEHKDHKGRSERRERGSDEERSDYREHKEHKGRRERGSDEDRSDYKEHKEHKGRRERGSDEDRSDYKDHKDHKGRDLAATGLSLAATAAGLKAVKNATRDGRDDRDDRDERRSDYDDEPRRRRDRDDRDSVDLSGRDPKERRRRDDDHPPRVSPPPRDRPDPRDIPPPPSPPPSDKDVKVGSPTQAAFLDLSGRDPRERKSSKDDDERRERRRRRSEAPETGSVDSDSDSSVSPNDTTHPARAESRLKRKSGVAAGAFNPKDTMGLMALKEALNKKDSAPKDAPQEPVKAPRESLTKDPRDVVDIRRELDERRPRDPLQPNDNRQLRVVSPPREKAEEKPVKGILRQPREKFPEDPAPIREGVAPLKDAKKDGIPPDARWTKISRKLVNPEALEAGKERFEAREDFVIVLRVLSRDEVQGYAEVTQRIRGLFYPLC
jgi:zinc finger CCCH domain-containing protein 13